MKYLDEKSVTAVRRTKPLAVRTRSGYGSKLPTDIMLQLNKRWYRVYVMIYSNAGSAYILQKGEKVLLGSYDPQPI